MDFIGNLIWIICGGFLAALGWFIGGVFLCFTIVGIPFGLQFFKIAALELMPFGRRVVNSNSSTGCLATIFNIIWIFTGGLYTAVIHLVWAFFLAITIIGIPFAKQHLKLMELCFAPFGKDIE